MVKSFTPSSNQLASSARSTDKSRAQDPSKFLSVALSMGLQLAIAVLVPIVGGYKLDQAVGSAPWLTLLGFVLALAASVVIVRRAYNEMIPVDVSSNDTSKPSGDVA